MIGRKMRVRSLSSFGFVLASSLILTGCGIPVSFTTTLQLVQGASYGPTVGVTGTVIAAGTVLDPPQEVVVPFAVPSITELRALFVSQLPADVASLADLVNVEGVLVNSIDIVATQGSFDGLTSIEILLRQDGEDDIVLGAASGGGINPTTIALTADDPVNIIDLLEEGGVVNVVAILSGTSPDEDVVLNASATATLQLRIL